MIPSYLWWRLINLFVTNSYAKPVCCLLRLAPTMFYIFWLLKRQIEIADSSLVHQGRFSEVDTTRVGPGGMVERWVDLWVPYLGLSIMIVWLTRLAKIMALQVDVNSSSRCADLAKPLPFLSSRFSARAWLLFLCRYYVRALLCPMVQVGYTYLFVCLFI